MTWAMDRLPKPPRTYRRRYAKGTVGDGSAAMDWAVERGLVTRLEVQEMADADVFVAAAMSGEDIQWVESLGLTGWGRA